MRRQPDDGNVTSGALLHPTDDRRRLQPVHGRHLHIHQNHVEAAALPRVDCLLAVQRGDDLVPHLAENGRGQLAVDRVVLRQQHPQRTHSRRCLRRELSILHAFRARARAAQDCLQQFRFADGLYQAGVNSRIAASLQLGRVARGRHEHDDGWHRPGSVLKIVNQRERLVAGHHRVDHGVPEAGAVGGTTLQDLPGLAAVGGGNWDHAPTGKEFAQNPAARPVVIHNQHLFAARLVQSWQRPAPAARRQAEAGGEMEAAPLPRLALDPDLATHQPAQLIGNRQAQARAAVLARDRGVGLRERFKDGFLLVDRHADAGVRNSEVQQTARVRSRLLVLRREQRRLRPRQRDIHGHLAAFGEFQRVADQVVDDLPEPPDIADDGLGHAGMHAQRQLQTLLRRAQAEHLQSQTQRVPKLERLGHQLQFARLDLREVEHVVDDGQQIHRGIARRRQVATLLARKFGPQRQFRHAHDGVHRRADFMAHVRQELALRPAGGLRGQRRLLELRLGPLAPGDVAGDAHEAVQHAVLITHRRD